MANKTKYQAERDLAFLLADASRKLNDAYDARMKPLGLTRSQWRVVAFVSRTPGITQTQLANKVELSRMAITGLLDRMQAKDLIERRIAADDRRIKTVHLTRKSNALVARMNQTAQAVLDRVFEGITPLEKKKFGQLLNLVKDNAEDRLPLA
jgi:DNA-binding MarR family transcriptional regulator